MRELGRIDFRSSSRWQSLDLRLGLVLLTLLMGRAFCPGSAADKAERTYVGNEPCKECHAQAYDNFRTSSGKSRSMQSVQRMRGLSPTESKNCLECHTTGYGEPGGFTSASATPHLANLGCESCHGPGSVHAKTMSRKDIVGKLNAKSCERCHNIDRVGAFKFKPLIFGGVH